MMQININSGDAFYSGHRGCLTRLLVLSIAVMVGAWLLPGVEVTSFWAVLITAVVISLLDNLVRPILIVVTLPVTVVTLGLFLFVINAIIILMASGIVKGFDVSSFGSALLFSLVLTAVNYLLEMPNKYLNRKELHKRKDDNTDDEGFTPYEEVE
ncbi:MAG: phage holin family protein [Bacteroidales bacterium]|nr:phage holin family protein [Bacteroidales bacterium]